MHRNLVKGTKYKAIVQDHKIHLCDLTSFTLQKGHFRDRKIYLNTRALKHIYDKRTAEEFDFIIQHLIKIARFPDQIYLNKSSTTGTKCLVKNIEGDLYLLSLEEAKDINIIVTCFRIRGNNAEKYLSSLKKL